MVIRGAATGAVAGVIVLGILDRVGMLGERRSSRPRFGAGLDPAVLRRSALGADLLFVVWGRTTSWLLRKV